MEAIKLDISEVEEIVAEGANGAEAVGVMYDPPSMHCDNWER